MELEFTYSSSMLMDTSSICKHWGFKQEHTHVFTIYGWDRAVLWQWCCRKMHFRTFTLILHISLSQGFFLKLNFTQIPTMKYSWKYWRYLHNNYIIMYSRTCNTLFLLFVSVLRGKLISLSLTPDQEYRGKTSTTYYLVTQYHNRSF